MSNMLTREERAARIAAEQAILNAGATSQGRVKFLRLSKEEGGGTIQGKDHEDHISGLFPLETDIPKQSSYMQAPNPCLRVFGPGPEGKTCAKCKHGKAATLNEQIPGRGRKGPQDVTHHVVVCEFRGETFAPRSTWLPGYPACGRYEEA